MFLWIYFYYKLRFQPDVHQHCGIFNFQLNFMKKKNNLSSLQWLLLNETYICFSAIIFFLILVHIIIISVVSVTCVLVFLLVVLVCWRISRSKLHTNEIRKLFYVVFIPTPLFYLMHHFRRLCLIYRNWYIL